MNSGLDFVEATEIIKELGVSLTDASGSFRYLADVLDEMTHKWNKCSGHRLSRQICDAMDAVIYAYKSESMELLTEDNEPDELDEYLNGFRIIREG